jgi:hypothetical protein
MKIPWLKRRSSTTTESTAGYGDNTIVQLQKYFSEV